MCVFSVVNVTFCPHPCTTHLGLLLALRKDKGFYEYLSGQGEGSVKKDIDFGLATMSCFSRKYNIPFIGASLDHCSVLRVLKAKATRII